MTDKPKWRKGPLQNQNEASKLSMRKLRSTTTKNDCCEECFKQGSGDIKTRTWICSNRFCPCHTTAETRFLNSLTPEERKEHDDITAAVLISTEQKCPCEQAGEKCCGLHDHSTTDTSDRKLEAGAKQFSKDFTGVMQELAEEDTNDDAQPIIDRCVESFEAGKAAALASVREMIAKLKRTEINEPTTDDMEITGYNAALSDLLDTLSTLE